MSSKSTGTTALERKYLEAVRTRARELELSLRPLITYIGENRYDILGHFQPQRFREHIDSIFNIGNSGNHLSDCEHESVAADDDAEKVEIKVSSYISAEEEENIRSLGIFLLEFLENLQSCAGVLIAFLLPHVERIKTPEPKQIKGQDVKEIIQIMQFLLRHGADTVANIQKPYSHFICAVATLPARKDEEGNLIDPSTPIDSIVAYRNALMAVLTDDHIRLLDNIYIYNQEISTTDAKSVRNKAFLLLVQWKIFELKTEFDQTIEKMRAKLYENNSESTWYIDPVLRGDLEDIVNKLQDEETDIDSLLKEAAEAFKRSTFEETEEKRGEFMRLLNNAISLREAWEELKTAYGNLELCRSAEGIDSLNGITSKMPDRELVNQKADIRNLNDKAQKIETRLTTRYFADVFSS